MTRRDIEMPWLDLGLALWSLGVLALVLAAVRAWS